MTLAELLNNGLQYDNSWAIYSFGTGADSPARIGQTQFENGGLLDGMSFVIDGVRLGDAWASFTDYAEGDDLEEVKFALLPTEFLDWLLEEDWIEFDNPECYQWDPGCPKCGGAVYGAEFPNGDNHGGCLCCEWEGEWDNEAAEWVTEA